MASLMLDDDGSKAVLIHGISWFGASMAFKFVATRLYVHDRLVHEVGVDDYLMVAALVYPFSIYDLYSGRRFLKRYLDSGLDRNITAQHRD